MIQLRRAGRKRRALTGRNVRGMALSRSLLDAYRATGADPPFGDPCRYHGVAMEGYFWRLTDVSAGRVIVALCGVSRAPDGVWATVALAAEPGGFLRTAIAPVATADTEALGVRAGELLVADGARIRVDLGPDARLDARLRDVVPWPRRAFGGLGPAHAVPGIGQYWHPHTLAAGVEGEATLGRQVVRLEGATAYAEKNWGAGFPGTWWWGQAHGFDRPDACVAFAGGDARLGPVPLRATALVVRLGDELVRLAAPLAHVGAAVDDRGWHLRGRGATHTIEVEAHANGTAAHRLPVPQPAERRHVPTATQHLAGRLELTVRRRGTLVYRGASTLAGLERGLGRPPGGGHDLPGSS